MKRILLVGLGLVILVLGARAVVRSLASDETKIRWRLEQMQAGYDEGDVGDAIGPFAKDWRHDGASKLTREYVLRGLQQRSFTGYDKVADERIWKLDVDWDSWTVLVEGEQATSTFDATFLERGREGWDVEAKLRVTATWEERSEGWFLVRSSHEYLAGRLPSL